MTLLPALSARARARALPELDLAALLLPSAAHAAEWQTVAEASDFRTTSSYDDTIAFRRRLWWYRRTPYWDPRFGQLPYQRVMAAGLPAVTAALEEEPR